MNKLPFATYGGNRGNSSGSGGSGSGGSGSGSSRRANTKDRVTLTDDDEAERRHIQKVLNAFHYYKKYAYTRLNKTEEYLNSLPHDDQKMLSKYRTHLECVRTSIERNQAVIKEMLRHELYPSSDSRNERSAADNIRHQDMDHAQSTLKLIARDWSTDGALEREQAYKPIIDTIEEFYSQEDYATNEIKILIPGAGLGRLLYELACRGYSCEGNEFSYFMLIASNFVLNQCEKENAYVLYPWVHQYVNTLRRSDQVAAIRFPDVCPVKKPPKGDITMSAGDFLEIYTTPNCYDCVATCFFIDCANNVIDFVRTIYRILEPGGIWVNLGPLLYHYSDMSGENSIEPTYEDLIIIIESTGFDIVRTRTGVRTKYAQNPQSMQKSEYESLFWICRKPMKSNTTTTATTTTAASTTTTTRTAENLDINNDETLDMDDEDDDDEEDNEEDNDEDNDDNNADNNEEIIDITIHDNDSNTASSTTRSAEFIAVVHHTIANENSNTASSTTRSAAEFVTAQQPISSNENSDNATLNTNAATVENVDTSSEESVSDDANYMNI